MKRKNKTSLLKNIIKTLPVLFSGVAVFYVGLLIKDIELPTVLPVNDVQVIGELSFIDKNEVELTVNNYVTGGYFTVDLNVIRERLMHNPWIKNVSLRRQWPASVDVLIDEQVPVAYWNNDGYISDLGEVFKPGKIDTTLSLPKLSGPEGHHNNVWKFMNVLYQEMALLEYEVVRLNLDDRRAWQLVIAGYSAAEQPGVENAVSENNRIDVKLGRFDTEKRLQRFVRILPALTVGVGAANIKLTKGSIKVIDMRYPNGFAVQMTKNKNAQNINILHNQKYSHNFALLHRDAKVKIGEA